MLLLPAAETRRISTALAQAGYKPVVPISVLDWAAGRSHSVLLTTDTAQAIAMLKHVLSAGTDARAVVLVQQPGLERYRSLLRHCTAALPADSSEQEIVIAVKAAHRALSCVPTSAARAFAGASNGQVPPFTRAELSWLRALADNVTVASLARASGYSQREMYRLLADLYARLGAATRTDALLRADRLGLLRPPPASTPPAPHRTAPLAPTGRPR